MNRRHAMVFVAASSALWFSAADAQAPAKEINFGFISTEASGNLKSAWEPVLDDLRKSTGLKVNAFFATDYAGIIEAMRFNKVQVAWMGNKSAMEAVVRAIALLVPHFPPAVTEPVRLHVAAKRYLTAVEPRYLTGLSPASVHSLAQQGGPMSAAEVGGFEALPFSGDAIRLRRWDERAKVPRRATPALDHCLALLRELRTAPPLS